MKNKILDIKYVILLGLLIVNVHFIAAQIKITGVVTDCEGKPLYGATVLLEKHGVTVANKQGHYKVMVPDTNSVLTYSFIGYQPQKIRVGNRDTINVALREKNSIELDSITVKGYNKKKKTIMVKKPVIYLYPTTKIEATVQLDYPGELLFTYPLYKNGWNVTAYPNGELEDKAGKKYSYLFWDGKTTYSSKDVTYEDGFIVHKDNVVSFLQARLSQYGLLPHEYNDFVVFWTPYLIKNELNFIHFRMGKAYDVVSKNKVTPTPETTIRIFMDFKKVDEYLSVEPQKIEKVARKGFTLVEWGGAELNQPIKIKTKDKKYINK